MYSVFYGKKSYISHAYPNLMPTFNASCVHMCVFQQNNSPPLNVSSTSLDSVIEKQGHPVETCIFVSQGLF